MSGLDLRSATWVCKGSGAPLLFFSVLLFYAPWVLPGAVAGAQWTLHGPVALHRIEGEPIVIPLTVFNRGEQAREITLSNDQALVTITPLNEDLEPAAPLVESSLPERYLGPTGSSPKVPPSGSAKFYVNLREWLRVVPEGRYEVTMTVVITLRSVLRHRCMLTVTRDAQALREKLSRLRAALLDPHAEMGEALSVTRLYDPRYTLDLHLRVLEETARSVDDLDFESREILELIIDALIHDCSDDPDAVLGRLAAFANSEKTPEGVRRGIQKEMHEIWFHRESPRLAAALAKHFGVTPEVDTDRSPSITLSQAAQEPIPHRQPRARARRGSARWVAVALLVCMLAGFATGVFAERRRQRCGPPAGSA